jgi:argininosuccinate lyase
MAKIWAGRTDGAVDLAADGFNSSLPFDKRLFRQDITGSMAHAAMLGATGIITEAEAAVLIDGLSGILKDLENGKIDFDPAAEDIHSFVEQILTERVGEAGKKLHTARSRNDQVALDLRLYLREETDRIIEAVKVLAGTVTDKAEAYKSLIMPGYTHLQRAQPVTFGHHLMAYVMMLLRDIDRLSDTRRRINVSPIGCCALAGTTYPTNRFYEAEKLGFEGIALNSIDGVSDRDFVLELLSDIAVLMMHLSRFSEEICLWSSFEFRFIELSDAFTTGSSIMPQKKNPDIAELVRGKTGRVYGDLMALLTTMKGLPLAYNKDMQEDKETVFDACDTVKKCLEVFNGMIGTMKALGSNMHAAAAGGFINATDLADYLVGKGLPFRTAYKLSGGIVAYAQKNTKTLEDLSLEEYRSFSPLFDEGVYDAVDLDNCVARRTSTGGTSVGSVEQQIAYAREITGA